MAADDRSRDLLQFEALLVARAYLYTLFHKLLGGTPDGELLDAFLGNTAFDVVEEYAQDSATMRGLLGFMERLRSEDGDELLDRARDEYARVFIGPSALPASPYESPYKGKHDMSLFQENTLLVREAYRSQGLLLKRIQAVPDDHVSSMCAFMSILSNRCLRLLEENRIGDLSHSLRFQRSFLNEHMGDWLGIYAASVRNSKAGETAVMYPQLLEALAAFAPLDLAFTQESSYWLESSFGGEGVSAPSPKLAGAYCALRDIAELKPFGIQDVELVSIADL